MSVSRMLAWNEIKEHKIVYGAIIIVIALTMASFLLENAYINYMMQVVNDTVKNITADAVVTNTDCNVRDLYGTETTIHDAGKIAQLIEEKLPGYKTSIRVTAQATYGVGIKDVAADACTLQGIDIHNDICVEKIKKSLVAGRFFSDEDPILRGHTPLYIRIEGPGYLPDIVYGSGQRLLHKDPPYPVIVGAAAAKIHPSIISVGKELDLYVSASARGTNYACVRVKIIGLYESGTPTVDAMIWFIPDDSLREIKCYGDVEGRSWIIPGIGSFQGFNPIKVNKSIGDVVLVKAPPPPISLNPVGHSESVREKIEKIVPDYRVFTWHDLLVYGTGSMQDVVTYLLWGSMGVTLVLCGFAIKYVMDSIIIRKMREIGSLKAFGARDRMIFEIFMYQGIFIGLVSGFAGIALAILVMEVVNWLGIRMNFIAGTQLKIGFVVNWFTVVITLVLPVVLSLISASIPAKRAAMLPPVEALRKGEINL